MRSIDDLDQFGQQTLLMVADHFLTRSAWPAYRRIEVAVLDQKPLGFILRDLPDRVLAAIDRGSERFLRIDSLAWFAVCPGSSDDVRRFLSLVEFFAQTARDDEDGSQVLGAEEILSALAVTGDAGLRLLLALAAWGGRLELGGSRGADPFSWTFHVSADALYFSGLTTAEEFEERQVYLSEVRMAEAEPLHRRGRVHVGGSLPPALPRTTSSLGRGYAIEPHPAVSESAGSLFASGHYAPAVREAAQRLEYFLQDALQDFKSSGLELVGRALGGDDPALRVNAMTTRGDLDEQHGILLMTKGVLSALRNPYSHGEAREISIDEALEQLNVISFIFRRLQGATRRQTREGGGDVS